MREKLLNKKARIERVISADRARREGKGITLCGNGAQIVLDVGERSASGYTVFSVASYSGNVKLRFAFSDRLSVFDYPQGRERGDFSRGAATYLGVELPVLPADPYRYQTFTVCRMGKYVYPLLQGQYRFVCVTLSGDGSVQLDDFYTLNASFAAREIGDFCCSDGNLTKLWHISARTVAIATVRARQTEKVCDELLLLPLTAYDEPVLIKSGAASEGKAEFSFSVSEEPRYESGVTLCLAGKEHTALLRIGASGLIKKSADGAGEQSYKSEPLVYDEIYKTEFAWSSGSARLLLNGREFVFELPRDEYAFGFKQALADRAALHELRVYANGTEINGLESRNRRAFCGEWFISDGCKRDRLPWSGDLEWAGKNAYYCFGQKSKMKNTLAMLLRKQNPEGYYFAVTYPEDKTVPESRDWGLYQSDVFCCWITVVMHGYMLFTGDEEFVLKHINGLEKSLKYLECNIDSDGLFYQRYETSKGLWDNELGDVGKHTYANILISKAFACFSDLCERAGRRELADEYAAKSERVRSAVEENLFDEQSGLYVRGKEDGRPCYMSSPLALALGFCSRARAERIRENCGKLQISSGKILSLLIEGLYRYGFSVDAFAWLTGKNEFTDENGFSSYIDWYALCDRDDCPHTTSECGLPPRVESATAECWGDRSHPDTALAHVLSGRVLGVRPAAHGFKRFVCSPDIYGLDWAEGSVPTPYGPITVRAGKEGMRIRYPNEIVWENARDYPDCIIEKV